MVFLVIVYDLFSTNNLFFQVSNIRMVMVLNLRYSKLINEFRKLDFKFSKFVLNLFFKDNITPDVYVFIKYNFFRILTPRYGYIYLDRCMIKALWKSFFPEFNEYLTPSFTQVYDLFDNFDNFDVFADFGYHIRNQ